MARKRIRPSEEASSSKRPSFRDDSDGELIQQQEQDYEEEWIPVDEWIYQEERAEEEAKTKEGLMTMPPEIRDLIIGHVRPGYLHIRLGVPYGIVTRVSHSSSFRGLSSLRSASSKLRAEVDDAYVDEKFDALVFDRFVDEEEGFREFEMKDGNSRRIARRKAIGRFIRGETATFEEPKPYREPVAIPDALLARFSRLRVIYPMMMWYQDNPNVASMFGDGFPRHLATAHFELVRRGETWTLERVAWKDLFNHAFTDVEVAKTFIVDNLRAALLEPLGDVPPSTNTLTDLYRHVLRPRLLGGVFKEVGMVDARRLYLRDASDDIMAKRVEGYDTNGKWMEVRLPIDIADREKKRWWRFEDHEW